METEATLIKKYISENDHVALNALVDRHVDAIYNFTYSLVGNASDADDVTQETFVKIWKNLKKFNPEKSFKTWAFSIARNTAIDYLRKRRSIAFSALDSPDKDLYFADTIHDEEPLAEEIFEAKETKARIEKLMTDLPPHYRSVISLRYTEDMTFEEIAAVFDTSVNTIKSRYRRGLAILKKGLAPKSQDTT